MTDGGQVEVVGAEGRLGPCFGLSEGTIDVDQHRTVAVRDVIHLFVVGGQDRICGSRWREPSRGEPAIDETAMVRGRRGERRCGTGSVCRRLRDGFEVGQQYLCVVRSERRHDFLEFGSELRRAHIVFQIIDADPYGDQVRSERDGDGLLMRQDIPGAGVRRRQIVERGLRGSF